VGDVGLHLRRELVGRYKLRVSDTADQATRKNEKYAGDVSKMPDTLRATKGVDAIVHLGAWRSRRLAAFSRRTSPARTTVSSRAQRREAGDLRPSNHAVGFYRRIRRSTIAQPRPDSRYGVSKAFGEALGALTPTNTPRGARTRSAT
jgi:uronate dehydrogenase